MKMQEACIRNKKQKMEKSKMCTESKWKPKVTAQKEKDKTHKKR